MPTRTRCRPSRTRTHSCSAVYCRSSGCTGSGLLPKWLVTGCRTEPGERTEASRRAATRSPSTLGRSVTATGPPRRRRTVSTTPPGMRSAAAIVCASPMARIVYGGRDRACRRRARVPGEPSSNQAGRDDPHVADLDRLGAGVAQLLDGVEQQAGVHGPVRVGDAHDARPGPRPAAVPARMPSVARRCRVSASANARELLPDWRPTLVESRSSSWACSRACALVEVVQDPDEVGLAGAAQVARLLRVECTWTAAAKPRPAQQDRRRAPGRGCLADVAACADPAPAQPPGLGRSARCSCAEQLPADRGDVGEDPDGEDDDDAGRQLRARRRAGRRGRRSARPRRRWTGTRRRTPCRRRRRRAAPAPPRTPRRARRRRRSAGTAAATAARPGAGAARARCRRRARGPRSSAPLHRAQRHRRGRRNRHVVVLLLDRSGCRSRSAGRPGPPPPARTRTRAPWTSAADGRDDVRPGQRTVVDEDRVAGPADRGQAGEPVAVDGHGLAPPPPRAR